MTAVHSRIGSALVARPLVATLLGIAVALVPAVAAGPLGPKAVDVAIGNGIGCALLSDRTLDCRGFFWYAPEAWPIFLDPPTDVVAIEIAQINACALLASGDVDCFGYAGAAHFGLQPFGDALAVDVGGAHACAIRAAGAVSCWGSNARGQAISWPGADAVGIAVGGSTTCVLRATGTIVCIGETNLTWTPAAGVRQIATDHERVCALLGGQTIECRGAPFAAALDFDLTRAKPVSIAVGGGHLCALLADGNIDCTGTGIGPAPDYLLGDAVGFDVGLNVMCALRVDRSVVCAGSDVWVAGPTRFTPAPIVEVDAAGVRACDDWDDDDACDAQETLLALPP